MRYIDDVFIEKVLRHGRPFITNFSILIKLTGMYQSMNEAVVNAAGRVLAELVQLIGDEGELSLRLAEESFFIEDIRIKGALADLDNFVALSRDLSARGIGAVNFKAPLQVDDLIFLAYAIRGGQEISEIQSSLESRMTKGISIGGPVFAKREATQDTSDVRAMARRAYSRAISSYVAALSAIKSGKKPNVKKVKRAMQSLVDCMLADEPYVLGLTTLRNLDQYAYQHPVNVAVYSVAIGQRLGLTKFSLSLLGLAALFHDIGKADIPLSILNKPKEFSRIEMELIRMHPVAGVKHILRSRGLNDVSILSMIVSLEHHLNTDGSGYPEMKRHRTPALFSRIVRVADDFDSMVSGRVYERDALKTALALEKMNSQPENFYDGRLFRAFFEIFKRKKFAF